jgi:hypothetical protein
MSEPEGQSLPKFHPAHWEAMTDQRHRMMDVRSVLSCARYALLNAPCIDAEGAVSIAHDVLDDIINELDSVSIDAATEKWLAERERR